jgi:hypothetical protein
MATVTAGALIAAGLRRASMVDSPTGFIAHPAAGGGEAFDMLNAALSELHDITNETSEAPPTGAKTPFSTVLGNADYDLDTITTNTFYELRGVDRLVGSEWVKLERANAQERNDYPTTGEPLKFYLEGDNIVLLPTPNAVYSMRLVHGPLPTEISADATMVKLKGPWREFIEVHIAIQAMEKEQNDVSQLMTRLYGPRLDGTLGIAGRIRNAAKKRDSSAPTCPIDVQGDWDPWIGGTSGV